MELKEFIKETLIEIIKGVDEAKNSLNKDGSLICPPIPRFDHNQTSSHKMTHNGLFCENVEFDLAVTVEEKSSKKVEAEAAGKGEFLKVIGVSASMNGVYDNSNNNMTTNRIKFKVPIAFKAKDCREVDV